MFLSQHIAPKADQIAIVNKLTPTLPWVQGIAKCIDMCGRRLDTLDPSTLRIQAMIELFCSLTDRPYENCTILREMGAWGVEKVERAYNFSIVSKVLYADLLK